MAVGVNISKINLAVASQPAAGVMISKVNLAVASHPPGRVAISKVNLAVASRTEAAAPAPSRRRSLFVS